jgi:hypothetical protein
MDVAGKGGCGQDIDGHEHGKWSRKSAGTKKRIYKTPIPFGFLCVDQNGGGAQDGASEVGLVVVLVAWPAGEPPR